MDKQTVLVTGAAGFIGSWISNKLLSLGHTVIGIDDFGSGFVRNLPCVCMGSHGYEKSDGKHFVLRAYPTGYNIPYKITKDNYYFYNRDLAHSKDVESICKTHKPTILYHLAASAREGASHFDPIKIHDRNSSAYIPILESFIRWGGKKVVLFSSMATYGDQTPPFVETDRLLPEDPYAAEKVLMEYWTKDLAETHDLNYTIIVPHNIFGESQALEDPYRNLFGIMMNRCMKNEDLVIYGDGLQTRQFSYIEDNVDCYVRCMNNEFDKERINIGGLHEITVLEAVEETVKHFKDYNSKIVFDKPRWKEVKHAWCDNSKAERLLGYKETVGWKKGIEKMAQWAKNIGPQRWMQDSLSLPNQKKMPKNWTQDR